jgi:hypothetical protein
VVTLKIQTGLRVDKVIFERFKLLCEQEKLGVGEAVQHLMEVCLKAGSVTSVLIARMEWTTAERKTEELRLKGALAQLKRFIKMAEKGKIWIYVGDGEVGIERAIYRPAYETALATLPKMQDAQLIKECEQVLEKANSCLQTISDI